MNAPVSAPPTTRLGPRALLVWGGLAVSALFAYLAVRNVDFRQAWHALRESDYWWLLPALAVLAVAVALRALRWQLLFAHATRPSYRATLGAMLVGLFFNIVLPARAGEAARIVALKQRAGTSRAEAAATVVLERAYDVLCLLVLLFVAVPWLPHVTWLRSAAIVAVALAAALVAAVVVLARYRERPLRALLRPLARLPFLGGERVEAAAANLVQGLAGLRQPRLALASLALTMASWLVLAVSTWIALLGFHLGLSPVAGVLVTVAINLAMILPSSPAAIGVFEAATLVALKAYGVGESRALSCAIVLHVLNLVPFLLAGSLVLHLHASSLRRPAVERPQRAS